MNSVKYRENGRENLIVAEVDVRPIDLLFDVFLLFEFCRNVKNGNNATHISTSQEIEENERERERDKKSTEDMEVELLLQFLVRIVDAKLLEAVLFEALEAVDVCV